MVNVTHHRDDWCTSFEIFLLIFHFFDSVGHLTRHILRGEAELLRHDVDGLSIQTLVDAHHHTDRHTSGNDLSDGNIHHRRKFVGSYELRDLKHLAFCALGHFLLSHTLVDSLTLVLAVLHALLLLLGCETSQCLLYLLCNFFLRQFLRLNRLLLLVLFLALTLLLSLLVLLLLGIVLTLLAALLLALTLLILAVVLLGCCIDVNLIALDAVALLLGILSVLTLCIALRLLTLFTAFSLTLAIRTCLAV